jgi:hypothetical protein
MSPWSESLKVGDRLMATKDHQYVVDSDQKYVVIPKGAIGIVAQYQAGGRQRLGVRVEGLDHPSFGLFGIGLLGMSVPEGWKVGKR